MSTAQTYPITAVCRLTGLRSGTLRRWERLGLLTPTAIDRRGRRYYDHGDLGVVLHLMLLRALGLPSPERTTWIPGAPSASLLHSAAESVAEQARIAPELCLRLRRDIGEGDDQSLLRLIGLLVQWHQA